MSNPTKTRRMPVRYCVYPGGVTEIYYTARSEPVIEAEPLPEVLLPGTRWLEARRAREQKLALDSANLAAQTASTPISQLVVRPVQILSDEDLAELAAISEDEALTELPPLPATKPEAKNECLAERLSNAARRLAQRQASWISALRSGENVPELAKP